ncbi:hypothetical protein SAMN04488072_104155 [Lentibacillus halodurans]|uniref:Uncharacterized protein n=1 Tax=Lentibacillus halodurans TaxID=237679 RepID=A0A1I0X6C9_9BACI|nr:hypothetical protein [Lentibacillus halodurans]SFA95930.1 hypothetical protein SAMN04488072_104155 [Lentibacillus halodurans]
MGYKYANHKAWIKPGRLPFINAAIFIVVLMIDAWSNTQIHLIAVLISFLFALVQGIQYVIMDQKNYIQIADGFMLIDRGFSFPEKTAYPFD